MSIEEGVDDNYTLSIADNVTQPEDVSIKKLTRTAEIDADGVWQFDKDFNGMVTIAATAKNVKLIGAGSQLTNVYIDATAVSDINLWIQDLNISSNQVTSVIRFGASTNNTLTVKDTNQFINSYGSSQALINVGGGLNIVGDGTLTADVTGESSWSAAIGSDYQEQSTAAINIGGSVNVTVSSTEGAGKDGSIGAISIGTNATVTVNSTEITDKADTADSIAAQSELATAPVYGWTLVNGGRRLTNTC